MKWNLISIRPTLYEDDDAVYVLFKTENNIFIVGSFFQNNWYYQVVDEIVHFKLLKDPSIFKIKAWTNLETI